MAVARVTSARPNPNRLDDFLAALGDAKRIFERAGARVRFSSVVAGSEPNAVLIFSGVDDWAQWAEVAKKLEADGEWADFRRKVANDPPGETLSSGIVQEFELPA